MSKEHLLDDDDVMVQLLAPGSSGFSAQGVAALLDRIVKHASGVVAKRAAGALALRLNHDQANSYIERHMLPPVPGGLKYSADYPSTVHVVAGMLVARGYEVSDTQGGWVS